MFFFEFHFEAAARHDSSIATPTGFMIQINTVHIEAGADLLDLPFVARQLFVEQLQKIHKYLAQNDEYYFINIPANRILALDSRSLHGHALF